MCGQKTSILRTQPSAQGQVPRKDAFAEDKARCIAAGMSDFIAKPVDPAQLYAVVLKWLVKAGR